MKPLLDLTDPPHLTDEAAAQLLDVLHELATAFENHYALQISRYYQERRPLPPDPFGDPDEESDPF